MCVVCRLLGGMAAEGGSEAGVAPARRQTFTAWLDTASPQAQVRPLVLPEAAPAVAQAVQTFQFFTGAVPSAFVLDAAASPQSTDPGALNSASFAGLSLENRYIDFAVGVARSAASQPFGQAYASVDLTAAARQAYAAIFGETPSDAKLHAILDTAVSSGGKTMTRAEYLADCAGASQDGLATKAALAGWLLAEAEKAGLGPYAQAADGFIANGAVFDMPLIGVEPPAAASAQPS